MSAIPEGWKASSGITSGSRFYDNADFPSFRVYDAGCGGMMTVYRGDDTYMTDTLAEAFALVGKKANPKEELDTAAALVVTSLSPRNLKDHNSSYTVTVPRHRIERLHQALEELYPGWVDRIYEQKAKANG